MFECGSEIVVDSGYTAQGGADAVSAEAFVLVFHHGLFNPLSFCHYTFVVFWILQKGMGYGT